MKMGEHSKSNYFLGWIKIELWKGNVRNDKINNSTYIVTLYILIQTVIGYIVK